MISISKSFLLFAIILLPFNYVNVIYNFSLSDLLLSVAFVFALGYQVRNRVSVKYLISSNDFILPILIYSAGLFLSMNYAFSPIDSLLSYLQVVFIFTVVYYALFLQSFSEIYIKRLLYALSVTSGLITIGIFF